MDRLDVAAMRFSDGDGGPDRESIPFAVGKTMETSIRPIAMIDQSAARRVADWLSKLMAADLISRFSRGKNEHPAEKERGSDAKCVVARRLEQPRFL